MGQVFVENMVLMLPGGVAGLLFSYVLVFIFRNALLVPGFNLLGTSGDVFLSPGMLLNMSAVSYTHLDVYKRQAGHLAGEDGAFHRDV